MTGAVVSAAEAARLAGVSARTMSRHLAAGKVPGAEREGGGWKVPVDGLVAAGYTLRTGPDPAPDVVAEAVAWRERALIAEATLAAERDARAAVERALGHAEARLAALPPAPVVDPADVALRVAEAVSPLTREPVRSWWRRGR